jgi:hypothetical protein
MHQAYRPLFVPFLLVPLAAAAWAGCSDQVGGDVPPVDAGPDGQTADVITQPEAATDASTGIDCTKDEQVDGVMGHLQCTGLYSSFETKTVAADAKPYTPGVQFWSDGAEKSRFLYLPPGAKIDIADFDEWSFPNGTKVWKEFRLGTKRIETRLYFKAKDAWRHTTYRWNDAETDAVRKDNGEKVPVAGKPPYEVPNTGQCNVCHDGRKEPLLGIDAVSLGIATAQGVTLASLAAEGRFSTTPPKTSITIPDDGTGKSAAALGWLHANCGSCHNNSSGSGAFFTGLFFLLRPSQLAPDGGVGTVQSLDSYKTAVGVNSARTNPDGGAPYVRIVKGDPASSIASILSGRRVPITEEPNPSFQMPPLVTRVPDTQGHALLDSWITVIP